jgi:hypothetical protein
LCFGGAPKIGEMCKLDGARDIALGCASNHNLNFTGILK